MSLLLDTHVALWFWNDDAQLPAALRSRIENELEVYVSAASLWEIAIKSSIGKLQLGGTFGTVVPHQMRISAMSLLPVEFPELEVVAQLPWHHSDPFDRILIAQSMTRHFPLVSIDGVFDQYGVTRLW